MKRGLKSLVNGAWLSVIGDTGATGNVISADYATKRKLRLEQSCHQFQLGNSTQVKSLGAVTIDFAFAEKPSKIHKILCHVLPKCAYDLILGNTFLIATETLTKHRHRLTECVFPKLNLFHLNFLGNDDQRLRGTIADRYLAHAIPDTGAETNVMDLGLDISI